MNTSFSPTLNLDNSKMKLLDETFYTLMTIMKGNFILDWSKLRDKALVFLLKLKTFGGYEVLV